MQPLRPDPYETRSGTPRSASSGYIRRGGVACKRRLTQKIIRNCRKLPIDANRQPQHQVFQLEEAYLRVTNSSIRPMMMQTAITLIG